MGYRHNDILSKSPYNDDFDATKNFLRILFNPSRGVQARELTQLQTLLQNQIGYFGSHIFKDGSQIFGGSVSLVPVKFLRVSKTGTVDIESLIGTIISEPSSTSTIRAKILHAEEPFNDDDSYYVLHVQYLSGTEFSTTTTTNLVLESNKNVSIGLTIDPTISIAITGNSFLVTVDSGVFYVDGFFVLSEKQTVSLYHASEKGETEVTGVYDSSQPANIRIYNSPTNRIGFELERTIITSADDESLKDPANGFRNFNASGADRYTINLNLVSISFNNLLTTPSEYVTEDFIEVARTTKGTIDYIRSVPTYSQILDILARRTYDESGSYTVKPFGIEVKEHLRKDQYVLYISSDSAYTGSPFPLGKDTIYVLDNIGVNVEKQGTVIDGEEYIFTTDPLDPQINPYPETDYAIRITCENGIVGVNDTIYIQPLNSTTKTKLGTVKFVKYNQDQSGTYSSFESPEGDESKLIIAVQPGKAYVYGYEFETINTTNLELDKSRDVDSVNGYNVVANVGNSLLIETPYDTTTGLPKFGNWNTEFLAKNAGVETNVFSAEQLPLMNLGSDYFRITIPHTIENKTDGDIVYWSPLFATERSSEFINEDNPSQGKFDSLLFVTCDITETDSDGNPNSLTCDNMVGAVDDDPTEETNLFIRPQNIDNETLKTIGGQYSKTSYEMSDMSFEVERNISKCTFTDPWHGEFYPSYSKEDLSGDTKYYTGDDYTVRQYRNLSQINPLQFEVLEAKALRWVPAAKTGLVSGSTLFISTDDATTFNLYHSPVVQHTELGFRISYGSSIKSVTKIVNVQKLVMKEPTVLGPCDTVIPEDSGYGSFEVGDIVKQVSNKIIGQNNTGDDLTEQVIAEGEVLSVQRDCEDEKQIIYVELSGSQEFVVDGDDSYTTIGRIKSGCAQYKCGDSKILDNSDCGNYVRIVFRESSAYGDFTVDNSVFQYDYEKAPLETPANVDEIEDFITEGTIIAWKPETSTLDVLETKGAFQQYYGWIYEKSSGNIKYGGRGWDTSKTHTINLAGDIEKASGIFINISETYEDDFIERQEKAIQIRSLPADQATYITGKDFLVGETVTQRYNGSIIAEGKVLSWTHRDPENPADESPSILVVAKTTTSPGDFREYPITANSIIVQVKNSVTYSMTIFGTTVTNEVIGTGRLRHFNKKTPTTYEVSFFDVVMNSLPDNSRKYRFNETTVAYDSLYDQGEGTTLYVSEEGRYTNASGILATTIYAPNSNGLIFPLPVGEYVKTITELDYRIQKFYNISFESGVDTLEVFTDNAEARFVGGSDNIPGIGLKIDGVDLSTHYIMIDNSNGTIVDFSDSGFSLYTNNNQSASVGGLTIIRDDDSSSATYTLIATLDVNPNFGIRNKVLSRNTITATLTKDSYGDYYAIIPQYDILTLQKVTTGDDTDISYKFDLYNGQTDSLYDWGKITLKAEYLAADGTPDLDSDTIIITYLYFEHVGEGPITVNSYDDSGISYDKIPTYFINSLGRYLSLASVIDLRPVKDSSGNIIKKWIPKSSTSFNVDYEYYLSRKHKLILTRDLKFKISSGISELDSTFPPDEDGSMTLYTIDVPSYTPSSKSVNVAMVDNRRYTMKDINDLDKRLQNVEYYTNLSLLEKSATEKVIVDESGLPKIKTGILVDAFSGHGISETDNPDFNAAIDYENNVLRPSFSIQNITLTEKSKSGVTITSDNIAIADYSEEIFITQPTVSDSITINPSDNVQWIGSVSMNPPTDSWFASDVQPDVFANTDGENDSWIFIQPNVKNNNVGSIGTHWNAWQTIWQGTRANGSNVKKNSLKKNSSTTIKTIPFSTPDKIVKISGERKVDQSVIPFMRELSITITVNGMKPNTKVFPFFDGQSVLQYCTLNGADVPSTGISTNTYGQITGLVFNIPTGKFRVGEKLFVLSDSATNSKSTATTVAEYRFGVMGVLPPTNIVSVRLPERIPSAISSNESNPFAQTFSVDANKYPQGIFLSSIDLFFKTKDATLPISLELRPVSGGYPLIGNESYAYPFSKVIMSAQNVNVPSSTDDEYVPDPENNEHYTRFEFSTPVHILPGEHAIVLKTNSSEYSIYSAGVGQDLLNNNQRITKMPYVGSLFRTGNGNDWGKDDSTDLMFTLNKCVFSGSTSTTYIELADKSSTEKPFQFELSNLNTAYVDFDDSRIKWYVSTTKSTSSLLATTPKQIKPNDNTYHTSSQRVINNGQSLVYKAEFTLTSENVSPLIDLAATNSILVKNMIENNSVTDRNDINYNGELDPVAWPPSKTNGSYNSARVRYISKMVQLEEDYDSTNIKIYANVNVPSGTKIQVFAKIQSAGKDLPFEQEEWLQLTSNRESFVSTDSEKFTELEWGFESDLDEPFIKYAIKICMYSNNSAIVPQIKDLRMIATL